ncbi:hypothetical protein A2276_05315 [candidate division WOR-1 bacterium RIFOXYA12_FULL_43_27]|uniref:PDZ domain-containing protein n=1 Tax=candidate division WOR-1 bacterium RIFOXYC2_FULL_46_14 TaxID=1802587 RepID=A0A1F4U3Y4_UNCSA|nr:MAG: hypothetical protein A2276_05315 [candidate division WOR-1 bacterium RIFOXYA12_FULL_43_27]OGC20085.1 MAG: hypothetical protein A2292_03320 [candidate division WOR-1 bacterium RIFOXYB2_FULL_46_45]OGC32179.1 MAG: hypothetical protein A2232_08130 [candidate division WOR-1 bacterium RIFOXYA2_FULL_46_56]OGC39579.1 MAG: hypothetical protein A2438_08495 [candidate division WOR-1 bacterium RIFOXYC2_FULL_46_14]
MLQKKRIGIFISLFLFAASVMFFLQGFGSKGISETPPPSKVIPLNGSYNLIADIVEQVGDAVVNIEVEKMEKVRGFNPFSEFNIDPELKNFFEDRVIPRKGAGSGFIVDTRGDILTNDHVVKDVDKIKVTLKDGRKFDGKVIGRDATLDLAIIKINADNLPAIPLGDSSKLRPGEWVIAIGNPYGFSNTVTAGIVSATGRELNDLGKKDLVQTDAAINPGNSGGPLINLKGEVVGINTAIVAQAQSIGFAIPINSAKEVMNDLIVKGKVDRPWLGVYLKDMDQKIADYLDLPMKEGVVVLQVVEKGPADKLGLKQYDIIKNVNGQEIKKSSEVVDLVAKMKPGQNISLKIYRKDKNIDLNGKIGNKP